MLHCCLLCDMHCSASKAPSIAAGIMQVLAEKLGEAAKIEIEHMQWLTFKNLEKSLAEDIKLLHDSPLISDTIAIHGLVYDVSTWIAVPVFVLWSLLA